MALDKRTGTAPFRPALAFVVDQGESEDATEVELIGVSANIVRRAGGDRGRR